MKLTYFGQSAFLIEYEKFKVVIDPFFESVENPNLDQLTHICITHGHADHLGDALALSERTGAMVIANAEISRYLKGKGLKNSHSMYFGGSWEFEFGCVKMVAATHGSGIYEEGSVRYGGSPCGFLLTINGIKLYHAGDTGLTYDMKLLAEEKIDYCLLPIGGNYTMGIDEALKACEFIRPKCVIPMHYKKPPLIDIDPSLFTSQLPMESKVVDIGEVIELERRDGVMEDRIGDLTTTEIADGQDGNHVMCAAIKPIDRGMKVFGPAFTVELPIGNSQSTLDAIDHAKPGDVLIIDAKGDDYRAVWGDVKTLKAFKKGIGGIVVDGAVRDIMGNMEIGLPIFCKSVVARAALKGVQGTLNRDVVCGDVVVSPGDYIVGDANGVVVIKQNEFNEVLQKAKEKYDSDQEKIRAILEG